jgi:hypothetical protein
MFTDHKSDTFNCLKESSSDHVLRTCWFLLLEEYGVTFEYLPGKKNLTTVVDALSRLEINSLKIQENKEEVLLLLSGSENNLQRTSKSQVKKIKRKGLSSTSLFNTTY